MMQYTVSSIRFLWAAYVLVAVAQFGHAGWLYSLWKRYSSNK